MKKRKLINLNSGELISDLSPKEIPELDYNINVDSADYQTSSHSDAVRASHEDLDINIFTVNGIPSRWEHNKKHANWHFDTQINPAEDPPIFNIVCKFKGDWSGALKILHEEGQESTIGNYRQRTHSKQDKDLHDAELMDVKRGSLEDDISCGYQINIHNLRPDGTWKIDNRPEFDVFRRMADMLGIEIHQMRANLQLLGQATPMHIDQQMRYNRPHWRKIWVEGGGDEDPSKLRRVLVNLLPWDYGHTWLFGSHYYSHYDAGEAITFDWCNGPHGTSNFGYSPRATLQMTGFISDKTKKLIDEGSGDLIFEV